MESPSQPSEPLNEQKIALIALWRARLLNENLVRQTDFRRPLVRIATGQRILQTPEWDSRYKPVWLEIGNLIGDEKKVVLLQNAVQVARQGGRPNAIQVRGLLAFLESPDIASRAISDFLLRQFYGGGPVFDPIWIDDANSRGVGLWRRFVTQAATGVR